MPRIRRPKSAPDHLRIIWCDSATPHYHRFLFAQELPDLSGFDVRIGGYSMRSRRFQATSQRQVEAFARHINWPPSWSLCYSQLENWSPHSWLIEWTDTAERGFQLSLDLSLDAALLAESSGVWGLRPHGSHSVSAENALAVPPLRGMASGLELLWGRS